MKIKLALACIGFGLTSVLCAGAATPKPAAPAPKVNPVCKIPVVKKAWFCNASQTAQKFAPQPMKPATR